eukprot:4693864-Prorocentrum_lima.AAC.1
MFTPPPRPPHSRITLSMIPAFHLRVYLSSPLHRLAQHLAHLDTIAVGRVQQMQHKASLQQQ